MVDVVTTQIYENGPRRVVMGFTNVSDGTGESAVVKVNASSTGPLGVVIAGQTIFPGVHLKVVDIHYDVHAMALLMQWQASSPDTFAVLSGFGTWKLLDRRAGFQGFVNPNTAGATGSIIFTTLGAVSPVVNIPSSYTIILEMVKGIPQS